MEEERPRVFLVEANGKKLYDRVRFQYHDKERTFVPDSALDLKRALPKLSTGEIELRESSIPNAGNGVFAGRDFSRDEMITYYDGPVVPYEEASKQEIKTHHIAIVHGQSYVIVGNLLLENRKPITNPAIELANLGVGAFLNDSRDEGKNNVEFVILDMKGNQKIWVDMVKSARMRDPSNRTSVRTLMPQFDELIVTRPSIREKFRLLRRMIVVRALRDIARGEELFVSYGRGYQYFGPTAGGGEEGKKRVLEEGEREPREDIQEKRQKCQSCLKLTVFIDPLTGLYYCSPECHLKECG